MGPEAMGPGGDSHSAPEPKANAPANCGPFGDEQPLPKADRRTRMEKNEQHNVAPNNCRFEIFLREK
jgi:hypothetical protein